MTNTEIGAAEAFWLVRQVVGGDPVVLEVAQYGYSHGVMVGPVRLYHHADRPEMGVCIDAPGAACDELGTAKLAELLELPGWTVTRLDVAIDGVPFTPVQLRDAWRAGQVRTRVKLMSDARPDRQWRTSDWKSNAQGDNFAMGSRTSEQYARCYDRRGPTRFELELKKGTAQAAAAILLPSLRKGRHRRAAQLAVGLVRRFVDFVDRSDGGNVSRAPLLAWWFSFVRSAAKVRLQLEGRAPRTVAETMQWVEAQLSPTISALIRVLGPEALLETFRSGRSRWGARHHQLMRSGGGSYVGAM